MIRIYILLLSTSSRSELWSNSWRIRWSPAISCRKDEILRMQMALLSTFLVRKEHQISSRMIAEFCSHCDRILIRKIPDLLGSFRLKFVSVCIFTLDTASGVSPWFWDVRIVLHQKGYYRTMSGVQKFCPKTNLEKIRLNIFQSPNWSIFLVKMYLSIFSKI